MARKTKSAKQLSAQRQTSGLSNLTFHKLNWLEWVTIILGLWFFFYPHPYTILFTILVCAPIAGILINGIYKPSITTLVEVSIDRTTGNNKYDVADFIVFPAWVIIIRIIIDYEFEKVQSLLVAGSIAFGIMLIIIFCTHRLVAKSTKNKFWIYATLLINVCLYSYGGTYGINCVWDNSQPKVYHVAVLDKDSRSGRLTTYYLKVAPWGNNNNPKIQVTKEQYNRTMVGDFINIDLKKGLLNIPWFYVEKPKD